MIAAHRPSGCDIVCGRDAVIVLLLRRGRSSRSRLGVGVGLGVCLGLVRVLLLVVAMLVYPRGIWLRILMLVGENVLRLQHACDGNGSSKAVGECRCWWVGEIY